MTWEDLKDEPTADLIGFMKCKDQPAYKMLADLAFVVITFRFQARIIDRCRRIGRKFNHDNATCDKIALDTFDRFYKYPFRFEVSQCEKKNLDIDNCVVSFLYRIAQNGFYDHYRKLNGDEIAPYDGTEEVIVAFPELDEIDLDEDALEAALKKQEKIEKALRNLGDYHLMIYLTYLAHMDDGFKMPRKLLQKLRDATGLKQGSIQVYKKEAFDEVDKINKSDGKKKKK